MEDKKMSQRWGLSELQMYLDIAKQNQETVTFFLEKHFFAIISQPVHSPWSPKTIQELIRAYQEIEKGGLRQRHGELCP